MAPRAVTAITACCLFVLNVALNAALFLPGESKYRDSIEGGYASMALFFSRHPSPFGWNPYQYFGLPAHDWYLPLVPYVSALGINLLPILKPEHVYRLVVTTMAAAVPVSMYLFLVYFTRRRSWAVFAAVCYTFLSPSYNIYPAIQRDQGITYLPWRLQVLVKYGEGPHNFGLALMPIALVACWHAATRRRFWHLFAAAALLAAISLTNWIACLATGWCCLAMLVAGVGSAQEHGFSAKRLLGAAALGYLFAAFWLTPAYVRTTLFNWPSDAFGYKLGATQFMLFGAVAAMLAAAWAWVRWRPSAHFPAMVALSFAGFFLVVGGYYWRGTDTIPESRRYVLEAEFYFFAALAVAGPWIMSHRWRVVRDAAMVALGLSLRWWAMQPVDYVARGWALLRPHPRQQSIEYRTASQLDSRGPKGRVFVGGGTRFRVNSWYLIPQVGGTFESGLRNRTALTFQYCIRTGFGSVPERRAANTLLFLRTAGVEYVAVHGPASEEHWRDFADPTRIDTTLERVWQEGDNQIYRVPFAGWAHLVGPAEYPQGRVLNENARVLEPLVAAMDDPARRLETAWQGVSRLSIQGAIPDGLLVSTRVAHDEGWRATQDGRPLPVEADAMGFVMLRPAPSSATAIELSFQPPAEQVFMTVVSALAWVGAILLVARERRGRRA
jgi:hypothetical protein